MRLWQSLTLGGLLATVPLACNPAPPTSGASPGRPSASEKVELSTVSYAGLNAIVAEQKGKVVLIDVWFRG